MWTIPFFLMKILNSSTVKFGALSETNSSSNPCCANMSLSLQTVAVNVAEFMINLDVVNHDCSHCYKERLTEKRSSIVDVDASPQLFRLLPIV